jgi:hypothetical protein
MVLGRAIATPPWIRAVVAVVVVLLETRRVFNSLFRFSARGCARERRPRIIRCCCASGRPSATERLIRCLVAQALGYSPQVAARRLCLSSNPQACPRSSTNFCFNSLRRLLVSASPRVEQADGGLDHDCPIPPIAEASRWLPLRRRTSSLPRDQAAAGGVPTRQRCGRRGRRLLPRASDSQGACWRTEAGCAEQADRSRRARRSVAQSER